MEVSRGELVFILCCYTMLVTVSGKTGSCGLSEIGFVFVLVDWL